jgi:FixJ family two-component response regulator/anti-sigma regulatory factor (Ser/Thr protein kinase)
MTSALQHAQVIIVDDESINLTIMEISLHERGCKSTCFPSATSCISFLERANLRQYHCLITDYSMPEMNGIDLLAKVKKLDPTLEVIVVTGENERKIIQESLRRGAFDFLDKPLSLEKFYQAVERAIRGTANQRQKQATEASLLAARSTGLFNTIDHSGWLARIHLAYAPKHQLGGDFIEVFETGAQRKTALFGDISGHDIQSALLSSHFLGSLYGRRSAPGSGFSASQLLLDYNQLLLRQREQRKGSARHLCIGSSLSVCCIELTPDEKALSILNAGIPAVLLIGKNGNVSPVRSPYQPLGWFEMESIEATCHSTEGLHCLHGFTDGLLDLASQLNVDVLSLIHHLQSLSPAEQQELLLSATDDILLSTLTFCDSQPGHIPLIHAHYHGSDQKRIDQFQRKWAQSLEMALPQLDLQRRERLLLACREAVINALKHGCKGNPELEASLLITYAPDTHSITITTRDPGSGHSFDLNERGRRLSDLNPGNLGLLLISKLVDELSIEDNGATLRMCMHQVTTPPNQQDPLVC